MDSLSVYVGLPEPKNVKGLEEKGEEHRGVVRGTQWKVEKGRETRNGRTQ